MKTFRSVVVAGGVALVAGCGDASMDLEEAGGVEVAASAVVSNRYITPEGCGSVSDIHVVGGLVAVEGFNEVVLACNPGQAGFDYQRGDTSVLVNDSSARGKWDRMDTFRVDSSNTETFSGWLSRVDEIAAAPSDSRILYATVRPQMGGFGDVTNFSGLFLKTPETYNSWVKVPSPGQPLASLDVNPKNPHHVVGMNDVGFWRSAGRVGIWTNPEWELVDATPKLEGYDFVQNSLVRGINDRTTIYLIHSYVSGEEVSTAWDPSWRTLIRRSTNDGRSFETVVDADELIRHFSVDPTDAKHIYWTSEAGMFSSRNGGDFIYDSSAGLPTVWTNEDKTGQEFVLNLPMVGAVDQSDEEGNPYGLYIWAKERRTFSYEDYLAGKNKAGFYKWNEGTISWERVGNAEANLSPWTQMAIVRNDQADSVSFLGTVFPGDGGGGGMLVRSDLK